MEGMAVSLLVGFLLASSSFWLISRLNEHYTRRERKISALLLKRGRKD